ncbi:MAG: 1-(5-phosphoribosyl)-5-[(5-phosphoribosylamino)methylideneamino] imidazole-4-carboxamide isomerase [Candidatus Thermoplasmatota archaeon]
MKVIPAIDLRGGRVVQLVGGDPNQTAVQLDEAPVDVARRWQNAGAKILHVVDLDRALGAGGNQSAVSAILRSARVPVQVGGGLRSLDEAEAILAAGATRVVLGTRAVLEPEFLREAGRRFGPQLIVAVDGRGSRVATHGWTQTVARTPAEVARDAEAAGAKAVLFTQVSVEGAMAGPDLAATRSVVDAVGIPVIASGGVGGMADLEALARTGAWGAVVGMALYTGRLDPVILGREL